MYCADSANGVIWKVSRNYFTNNVGDVLATLEGDQDNNPRLVIVHWTGENFVTATLVNTNAVVSFEHVTFSPH